MKAYGLLFWIFCSYHISAQSDSCFFYVPNVVTMNCSAAGHDYELQVYSDCVFDFYTLNVYDRWGELLFSADTISGIWHAESAPDGVYIWQICALQKNGNWLYESGHVAVLR